MNRFREPSTSGGISPITLDITSPENAENSRSEGDERFRNLVESSLEGVVVHRNDHPLFANQAAG